jgi:hypothetical protein
MLDLNHPQTEYIFAAARLEDAALECAKRIVSAPPSERLPVLTLCERSVDTMRKLNSEHFGSSASIASAIDELQAAIRRLAASASPDMSVVRPAFTRLDSDDGFRTVWI